MVCTEVFIIRHIHHIQKNSKNNIVIILSYSNCPKKLSVGSTVIQLIITKIVFMWKVVYGVIQKINWTKIIYDYQDYMPTEGRNNEIIMNITIIWLGL